MSRTGKKVAKPQRLSQHPSVPVGPDGDKAVVEGDS